MGATYNITLHTLSLKDPKPLMGRASGLRACAAARAAGALVWRSVTASAVQARCHVQKKKFTHRK